MAAGRPLQRAGQGGGAIDPASLAPVARAGTTLRAATAETIAPLAFGIVTLAPIVVLLAALPSRIGEGPAVFGLGTRTLGLLWNTAAMALLVAAVAALAGTGIALWLATGAGAARRIAATAFVFPLLMPIYVFALTWSSVLGRQSALNRLLESAAGFRLSSYGLLPTVLTLSLALSPVVTLAALAALRSMEPEQVEAARLSSPDAGVWRRVVLPQAMPGVRAGVVVVFALALVDYGVPALFQFNVYSMEVYAEFAQHGDPVAAAGTALPLLALVGAVFAVLAGVLRRAPLRPGSTRRRTLTALERPRWLRIWVAMGIGSLLLAVLLPAAVLAGRFGGPSAIADAVGAARDDLATSIGVGIAAAVASVALALPVARWLDRRGGGWPWALVVLPLAVPAPLFTIGLIRIWSRVPGDAVLGRMPMLLLAHVGRLLPVAVIVLAVHLRRVDRTLFDAALLHDVGPMRRARSVMLPLMAPALIAALGIVFVLSLGELGASLLAVPPGASTLPLRMFNLLHYGAGGEVAALALTIAAIVIATLALSMRLVRR